MSAPAPTSEIDVCNLMLGRLGQKQISSIDPPSGPFADVVALHYPMTRRAALRGGIWNFAKKLAQITASGTVTPAFGYSSAFALPNDFLRLLSLGDYTINDDTPPGLYDIVDGHIYTDESDDGTLNIAYIRDHTVVKRWDALFVNLMRVQGAKDMAYAFTLKPSLLKSIDDELQDIKLEAKAIAGQEKPPRRISRSKLLARRRLGGMGRDTSRW